MLTMNYFGVLVLSCLAVGIHAANSNFMTRLTNNDVVLSPTQYPYQVSLQIDNQHICGGSIIGKKHILTAAHCTYDLVTKRVDKSRIKVVVDTTTTAGGTRLDVDRIAIHGSYVHSETRPTLIADISVIRLKNEITESDSVKIIGLPADGEEVPEGTKLIITGYGTNRINGPPSPVLKHMHENVVGPQRCQQAWASMLQIGPGHLCAALAPGYGACQGDSGGPLVKENKQVIVGVVSAVSSLGCGTHTPDLFTKVSYYLSFIRSEMANTDVSTDETQGWTGGDQGGWNGENQVGWNDGSQGGWNGGDQGGWNGENQGGWNGGNLGGWLGYPGWNLGYPNGFVWQG